MTEATTPLIEDLVLLRTTGEISPEQDAVLTEALRGDPELAAMARRLETDLALMTRATRDFAAEAIATVHGVVAPRDFAAQAIQSLPAPQRQNRYRAASWGMAAAAALALFAGISTLLQPDKTPPSMRRTAAISSRLDAIESELTLTREHRFRHRVRPTI